LALAGLLLAVLILFERFIAIDTQLLRVSFAYIPYMIAGWLLGPVWAGLIGVLGDLLGMLLMPKSSFFAGFTLNALLTGGIYGLFLYHKPTGKLLGLRLVMSLLTVHLVVHLGLTTLWLSVMYKKAFLVIVTGRIVANVIELPVEFASMFFIMRFLEKPVHRYLRETESETMGEDDLGDKY
jgi:ECF transporter S component (folate family)